MNKNILRMASFAVGLAAMTSCSDDLGIESRKFLGNADLVATLQTDDDAATRMGMLEVSGTNPWSNGSAAGWQWVFTEGDQLRVFTMESMVYHSYDLVAGAGTSDGEFKVTSAPSELPENAQKYAISDAQFAYSVSPNTKGEPVLTYTIPYTYSAQTYGQPATEDGAAVNVQKLPAPFWGKATTEDAEGENGKILNTSLWATTAFLRINMDVLPEGTKYIVLTTHGSATMDDDGEVEEDGFQLLTPDPDNAKNGTDKVFSKATNEYINYSDKDAFWNENAELITDGNSEPISGTFSALLTEKGKAVDGKNTGAYLQADNGGDATEGISRLVTKDEIVIDVTQYENNGVFWIPLIPQHYNNLYVMAVTKMSKKSYKYVGTMLKTYTDTDVLVGKRYHMEMNMTNLGKVCAHELNVAIKAVNKANKYGMVAENIINVDELVECDHTYKKNGITYTGHADMYEGYGVPCDQIYVQGAEKTNLTINIAKISAAPAEKGNFSPVLTNRITGKKTLFVSDHNYLNSTSTVLHDGKSSITTKSVRINVPFQAPTTETAGDAETEDENAGDVQSQTRVYVATGEVTTANALFADLLNTDAIFAANTNFAPAAQTAGKDFRIDVRGAATECVNGRELKYIVNDPVSSEELKNGTDAAVTVESGFGQVNVLSETLGDVYITGLAYDQKVELAEGLFIYTSAGVNVRMDNALSKVVGFPYQPKSDNYLITTGSSAVQEVGTIPTSVGQTTLSQSTPNKLHLQSYWTGHALDAEAENIADYDVETVYTVAQLASMGEKINDASDTNDYTVSSLLTDMWLGGKNYGWVGAQVVVDDFSFDGNGVALKNMWMPKNVKEGEEVTMTREIWVKDPHICCTSCGWNRESAGTQNYGEDVAAVAMQSFGLIRSIKNNENVLIKNVALNDVNAEQACNNIGSLVGTISAGEGAVVFDNNSVGEIRIDVEGDYVGGLVGIVSDAASVTVTNNKAANSQYSTGKVIGSNYVGGFFGQIGDIEDNDPVNIPTVIENSIVDMAGDIKANGKNAGGLIGNAFVENLTLKNDKVNANDIAAGADYAAGLIGYANVLGANQQSGAVVDLLNDKVNVNSIAAENYAAGFIGQLDSPFVNEYGVIEATNADNKAEVKGAVVNVKENISANDMYAAGLIAYDNMSNVTVYSSDIKANIIESENGFVGGEIAYVTEGQVVFGYARNVADTYATGVTENNVQVGTLKSYYNVGGLVGNNDNNAKIEVKTCESATGNTASRTIVNITKFENSKGAGNDELTAFFNPSGTEQKSHLAGTMSNIVGKVDGELYINEYRLTVTDNLNGDMKAAIGYQLHNDENATPNQLNRLFWGDYNGYVGFGKTGNYYLTSKSYGEVNYTASNKVVADQGGTINGFNLYKSAEDYNETSKLAE